ncbi:hypothetical protein HK104_011249 [Borealophlyctis nickersoniae]|nr:hypothetical protein HK104_011249 [Borealophlyctis nickersoniae]
MAPPVADFRAAKRGRTTDGAIPANPHPRYIHNAASQDDIVLHAGDVVAILPDPTETDEPYWLAKITSPVLFSERSPLTWIRIRYYDRCALPSKFRPRSAAEREDIAETFFEMNEDSFVRLCSVLEDEDQIMIAINWDEEDIVDGKYYLVDKTLDERLRDMAWLTARNKGIGQKKGGRGFELVSVVYQMHVANL